MSEQSKQIEAQKREDMLMDMYKLHAYIPNDAEGNPLTPFGNFCAGYKSATAEANKRMAELEGDYYRQLEFSRHVEKINDTLRANNNDLREALEGAIKSMKDNTPYYSIERGHLPLINAEQAISATPAESLQAQSGLSMSEKHAKIVEELKGKV